jgi:hypothetical protein
MFTRNQRDAAQPVTIARISQEGEKDAGRAQTPGYPLLDPDLSAVPSVAELERIVTSRAERIYPDVPREAIARAAHQSAEAVLKRTNPRVATFLPDLALREARAIIALYIALGEHHHLRAVA